MLGIKKKSILLVQFSRVTPPREESANFSENDMQLGRAKFEQSAFSRFKVRVHKESHPYWVAKVNYRYFVYRVVSSKLTTGLHTYYNTG